MSSATQPQPDAEQELIALRRRRELATWAPAGREVRPGTWAQQARPTPDAIEDAVADGRLGDAARLARHLVVEAQEIHDLYTAWTREIPTELERRGVPAPEIEAERRRLLALTGAVDPELDWAAFRRATETFAAGCERQAPSIAALADALVTWRAGHDRHLDLVAGWIDVAVARLGEDHLGDLWRRLQADGIAAYARYDVATNPWPRSRALLLQTAIEGMHGHLGGPRGRGEVEVAEHADRIELRFSPCGSGGRLRAAERFGVTTARHDWAWNETGVCHYCAHCCVLQQLEPIDRLGYPARVIDPPLRPGDDCTWTVYNDPSLVPEAAYRRVGRRKPGSRE
jgi:hypothetical protein